MCGDIPTDRVLLSIISPTSYHGTRVPSINNIINNSIILNVELYSSSTRVPNIISEYDSYCILTAMH